MFAPDSTVAPTVALARGHRLGVFAPRTARPVAIVIHTTGAGPGRRFHDERERQRHGYESPFDAAVRVYTKLMKAGPHYVVGQGGERIQVAPEDVCAWHVGSRGARPYHRHEWTTKGTGWWLRRWSPHGITSPHQLAGGRLWRRYARPPGARLRWASWMARGSCNANTIGIEVVPPLDPSTGPWSDQCWGALLELVHDIATRHDMPLAREHILTHSDAHPLARSRRDAPWDTSPAQFTWERFHERTI